MDGTRMWSVVAEVFGIPVTNVFFDDADTSGWDASPLQGFIYTLPCSDVAWMLALGVRGDLHLPMALFALAADLNSTVLFDACGQENVDDVIAFSPTGARAPAVLGSHEEGDMVLYTCTRAPVFRCR